MLVEGANVQHLKMLSNNNINKKHLTPAHKGRETEREAWRKR